MKKGNARVLVNGGVFALLCVVALALLNLLYWKAVLPRSLLLRSDMAFHEVREDVAMLVVGDSHVIQGVDPSILGAAYNFSSRGENYVQTYYKLMSVLKEADSSIDTVILPLDMHSFSSFRSQRSRDEWYWRGYMGLNAMTAHSDQSYWENLVKSFLPMVGNGLNYLEAFGLKEEELRGGYIPTDKFYSQNERREEISTRRVETHFMGADVVDRTLQEHMEAILGMLEERGIRAVLVKMPVTRQYYEIAREDYPEIAEFLAFEEELPRRQPWVCVLDFRESFFDDNDLFFDSDHLNRHGAARLTRMLRGELEAKCGPSR